MKASSLYLMTSLARQDDHMSKPDGGAMVARTTLLSLNYGLNVQSTLYKATIRKTNDLDSLMDGC